VSENPRILDLRDYWQMIRTRMWTVVAMATVVAAIAGAYVALRPPTYFAQAKVIVEPLVNPAVSGTVGNSSALQPDMVIEGEIVRGIEIATAVREELGLSTPPEKLAKTVRVEPVKDAAVMYIGYPAGEPETAATIANAFAEQYLVARAAQIQRQIDAAVAPQEAERDRLVREAGDLREEIDGTDDPNEIGRLQATLEGVEAQIVETSTKIAEIRANGGGQGGQIVQFAAAPNAPSGPSLMVASILGFILGAMIGAGLAIVMGLRANRVGGRDELADYIGASVMGVIPSVDDWGSRDKAKLVTLDQPGGPAAEAYRTLATNIRFLRSQRAVGVILVTSALPGEGKSATTANLSVVLAETGIRTLLVDADLRRPRAERFFGVPNGPGLREALEGSSTLDDVVLATDVPNLSILRSGQMPHDPVALLAGSNAGPAFHDIRRFGEIVICDAPPTLPVADASILAAMADLVLFVHDPAISSRTALEDAVRQLRTAGAEIAGGVYNNITSLQRTSLGYASYDQYYGPDDKARQRSQQKAKPKRERGSKRPAPKQAQEAPKQAQEAPKQAQEAPKQAQEAPPPTAAPTTSASSELPAQNGHAKPTTTAGAAPASDGGHVEEAETVPIERSER
jgi:capsular exopolysaccharide synthesis family protein